MQMSSFFRSENPIKETCEPKPDPDPSPASVDAPVAFSSVELAISSSPDMDPDPSADAVEDPDPDSVSVVVESLLSTPLAFSRVSFKAPLSCIANHGSLVPLVFDKTRATLVPLAGGAGSFI